MMRDGLAYISVAAFGLLIYMNRETVVETVKSIATGEPLGIRLNNPGNIEINRANRWEGEVRPSSHSRYAQFLRPEDGIRALAKTLKTYREAYGLVTIRQAVNRWAPEHENDTEAYIRDVEARAGINADKDYRGAFAGVVKAIIWHENGKQPYSNETINLAIQMAGGV